MVLCFLVTVPVYCDILPWKPDERPPQNFNTDLRWVVASLAERGRMARAHCWCWWNLHPRPAGPPSMTPHLADLCGSEAVALVGKSHCGIGDTELKWPDTYFTLPVWSDIRRNGRRYQHVLVLRGLLTGVILKGLTLRKFVSDICVCMFYVCEEIGFVDWLDRGLIYVRRV